MEITSLSDLIAQISIGLDAVEADLVGATPYHSKRVAVISIGIGKVLGYDTERLFCLGGCALLHDNALTEYILSERPNKNRESNLKIHCVKGQENGECFPFPRPVKGYIQYHHERVDGRGAFGKKGDEFPEEAGIIALADQIDIHFSIKDLEKGRLEEVRQFILAAGGKKYLPQVAKAGAEVFCEELLESIRDERIFETLRRQMPEQEIVLTEKDGILLFHMIAQIIDYKSNFTKEHTTQIANKAWYLSNYYGYDKKVRSEVYQAAALHDIGKLFIPVFILEKPGKLNDEEFQIIKSHAAYTWDVLRSIRGFEQIAVWASDHHEKLDGSGYPFGKTGAELDFNSRLLACLDIYQAVREARPYHPKRSHEDTMQVLYQMAERRLIDQEITADLDRVLGLLKDGYAPDPDIHNL